MYIGDGRPQIELDEVFQLLSALKQGHLGEGPKTRALEDRLADFVGCPHVILVPNGTLGLYVALKVLGIGPGDEVIVPDFTSFATISAVILAGARPVLVDVDSFDFGISPNTAERSISRATKAVVPVHLFGQSCDMMSLTAMAQRHGLRVIEDAAQSLGVTFGDRHVGTIGDIGCLSFHVDKTLTTGEGGALLVNDGNLADQCRSFKNLGRRRSDTMIHERMGGNFRVTDLQAALGLAQMSRIDATIEHRKSIREWYHRCLADCPHVELARDSGFGEVVPYRVAILVRDPEGLGQSLDQHNIKARRFYYPLHLQPCLDDQNVIVREKPITSIRLFERGLLLPVGHHMTEAHVEFVSGKVREFQERPSTRSSSPPASSPMQEAHNPAS